MHTKKELWILSEIFREDFLSLFTEKFPPDPSHFGQSLGTSKAENLWPFSSFSQTLARNQAVYVRELPAVCLPNLSLGWGLLVTACLSLCRIFPYQPSKHTQKP